MKVNHIWCVCDDSMLHGSLAWPIVVSSFPPYVTSVVGCIVLSIDLGSAMTLNIFIGRTLQHVPVSSSMGTCVPFIISMAWISCFKFKLVLSRALMWNSS